MKKQPYLLCLLSLLCSPAFSQNWNLVTAGSKYNFQLNTAAFVTNTIRVDSAVAVGVDSVFWLSQQKGLYVSGYPYIVMIGNLLGDSIVKHPGGVYECGFRLPLYPEYEQTSIVIQSKAEAGDSWEFRPGITATVTEKKDTLCWNIADSIKTISLSDGNTMRLSQHFGLLFSENQTLVGLQGQDVGTQLPVLADFYADWVDGAVFEKYHTLNENYGSSVTRTWTKYYVQDKTVGADSIRMTVRKLVRREAWSFSNLLSTTFENIQTIVAVPNPQQVSYPGTLRAFSFGDFTSTYYENTPEGLQLSVTSSTPPGYGGPIRRNIWIAGIGETQFEFTYGSMSFSSSRTESLSGYRKVGQTQQGTIHPDEFFGIVTSVPGVHALDKLAIFPNPTDRQPVQVICDSCPPLETADWLNVNGQVIRTFQMPAFPLSISVDGLPGGVYLLRVRSVEGAMVVRKVVVR